MKLFKSALLLLFIICFASSANAFYVRNIDVRGNKRVDKETILSAIPIDENSNATEADLNQSLKDLYKTQYFEDADIKRSGQDLVITVTENPIISRVVFEGNDDIDDDTLKNEVSARPRAFLVKSEIQKDVNRITQVYKRSGRYSAKVDAQIIERGEGRVDLAFEIDEGHKTFIKELNFIGNEYFSDSDLKDEILSKSYAWYRILSTSDTFDPDRIKLDEELLRNFYMKNGFVNFEVLSVNSELDTVSDFRGFFVTFNIKEGEPYNFGDIEIDAKVPDLNSKELMKNVLTEKGELYNIELIQRTLLKLTSALGKLGYGFVNIRPIPRKNKETKTVDIKYVISEGPRTFIDEINVNGNVRTFDYVIKRQVPLDEKDTFNAELLKLSKANLARLGYFKKVDINTVKDEKHDDRIDIEINVEEQPTGSISFGGGYNTSSGWFLQASVKEQNFMGKGQKVGISATFSDDENSFNYSFIEPYFLDMDLWAGYDLYYTETGYDYLGYDEMTYGINLKTGWDYTNNLSQSFKLTLKNTEPTDFEPDVPQEVRDSTEERALFMLGQSLSYGRGNETYKGKWSYSLTLKNDYAGFGSDEEFLRSEVRGRYNTTLLGSKQLKFILSAESGYIDVYAEDGISSSYNYYLGGQNLRGFERAGIGARSIRNLDYGYGGLWKVNGTAQVIFPVGIPAEYGFSGFVFYDFGMLGEPYNLTDNMIYDDSMRTAWGWGFSWASPMGVMNLSWGYPIDYEEYDKEERFLFSIGTNF
jgi:outer membrane protein insertion porin family